MEQLHNNKQFCPPVPNIMQKLLNNHSKNNLRVYFSMVKEVQSTRNVWEPNDSSST